METILVTGGAGFIGSHVCDALISRGKKVICLDNLNNYYSPKVKINNIRHNFQNPNFQLVVLDIRKKDELEQVFGNNQIDKVIHLAARAGVRPSIEKPLWYQETNVDGTVNLLELSKKYKIRNFIFGSSSSVYANNKTVPFSESDKTEEPISPYAASKKACELFCYTYSYLTKLNVTCLRFFTVYGPRCRPDLAPYKFTDLIMKNKPIQMYGDGSTKRDYTYITDIVDGITTVLDKDFRFEIINLGNSEPVELKKLIQIIESKTRKARVIKKPIPMGDVLITYADINKAKQLLGYEPKVSIEEGIARLVEWYKEQYV